MKHESPEKNMLVGEISKMMHEMDYEELLRFRDAMMGGILMREVYLNKSKKDPPDKKGA